MDYSTPSSYKNYLPSKKIRIVIGILVIIAVAYFVTPWIIARIKKATAPAANPANVIAVVPAGDPTTRDTLGDGIPDWEKIAVGLDPTDPASTAAFEKIKNAVGAGQFDLQASQVTDTDKMSLAIYNELAGNSIQNNGATVSATQQVTSQELYNYIAAQKKLLKTYALTDFSVVQDTLANNQAYHKSMQAILADSAGTNDGPAKINAYLNNQAAKSTMTPILTSLQSRITAMLAMSVPESAAPLHLNILNEMQEIYQLVDSYDPTNTDPTLKLSTLSLVQDDLINAAKNIGSLSIYFSIALDPKGYVQ